MIFILTGKGYKNKKIIQNRFLKFVRSDRRNWRRSVFLFDDEDFENTESESCCDDRLYNIVEYIHKNENDIVISVSYDIGDFIELIQKNIEDPEFCIIHFTDEKIKDKDDNIIYVNVTKYSVDNQYSKFIQKIHKFF